MDYLIDSIESIIKLVLSLIIIVVLVYIIVNSLKSQFGGKEEQPSYTEITCDNSGTLDTANESYYYLNDTHIIYAGNASTDADEPVPVLSENGLHFIYDDETESAIETEY